MQTVNIGDLTIFFLFAGLLHPSLLSGEGGYYLTTLSSAVHVLKNFKDSSENPMRYHVNSDVSYTIIIDKKNVVF